MFPCPDPQYLLWESSFPGEVPLEFSPSSYSCTPLKPEATTVTLFPFSPPPFIYQDNIQDILSTIQLNHVSPPPPPPPPPPPDPSTGGIKTFLQSVPPPPAKRTRSRASRRDQRTDRHSKIHTVQGPRDRRMRLSLDVARRFFRLQDRLGFDRPSMTLDWLLNKSQKAISELADLSGSSKCCAILSEHMTSMNSESSASSNCKVLSAAISYCNDDPKTKLVCKKAMIRRPAAHATTFTRESRAMARARARERTSQKKTKTTSGRKLIQDTDNLEDFFNSSANRKKRLAADEGFYEGCAPDDLIMAGELESNMPMLDDFENPIGDDEAIDHLFVEEMEMEF